jgi:hypothetical protein
LDFSKKDFLLKVKSKTDKKFIYGFLYVFGFFGNNIYIPIKTQNDTIYSTRKHPTRGLLSNTLKWMPVGRRE